ncbi:MAG: GTPase Era [Chitinophagaceae bacterium]|nr:GTPase Era [Chitinophagaceae bacterium]
MKEFKSGYVSIVGKPNAGKSSLMNELLGEKLAIVSPKAQTTRQRIIGILSEENYQIIFTDTPGILESKYKLQEKMLNEIIAVRKETDVVLYVMDATDDLDENIHALNFLKIKKPTIFLLNKIDKCKKTDLEQLQLKIIELKIADILIPISINANLNIDKIIPAIENLLPIAPPFYDNETLTDKPIRFFVAELVREKLFFLLDKELPYHAAVIVRSYEEKNTLTKVVADIIVSRETQKQIIIGKGGSMIQKIAEQSRADIEKFIDRKVFLELKIKVRKNWRENDLYLKEYGY